MYILYNSHYFRCVCSKKLEGNKSEQDKLGHNRHYSGIFFFIPVSSFKVFGHSIHRRIYPGKSIEALQNDTIIISWLLSFRIIQPRCSGILKKKIMFVCFHILLLLFTRYLIIKYLINVKPITSSHKIQTKIFTCPNMSFYAR